MCFASIRFSLVASFLLVFSGGAALFAQSSGERLASEHPQLGGLFNAFDVTQGAMFERVVEIGRSGESEAARGELRQALNMQAEMEMGHGMMMAEGPMVGPFGALESQAVSELTQLMRQQHSVSEAREAFANSEPLPSSAAGVLRRGREFEARIFEIYVDSSVGDKTAAVDAAVAEYLSDSDLAVPSRAKQPSLLTGHPFANAFRTGYPELAGWRWAQQWLKLASLEPIMLGGDRATTEAGVRTTLERFNGKIEGMQGMSMLPSELPMAPAISPVLYSRHQAAAIILDNLVLLETIVADLLVHPDVQDRGRSIDAVVSEFTNPQTNLVEREEQHLLFALRGGIFAQGGPALGQLAAPERNRSRAEMEMGHTSMPMTDMN